MSLYRHLTALTLVVVGGALSFSAQAVSVAAETGVTTISPCPSFCGGGGGVFESDLDGGPGFTSSFSSITTAAINGVGQAQATLNGGGIGLPTLRAEAFSLPNASVSAGAAGMRKFDYNGASSNFVLNVTLDGTVIDGPQELDAVLSANVIAFTAPDIDFTSDYGTMRFEVLDLSPGVTILDEVELNFEAPTFPLHE